MPGQLEAKVAVITGAGRGQGLAAALLFAAEGARIVINDLDDGSVGTAVEAVRAAGGEAVGAPGDVSNAGDVQAVLRCAADAFGGIDILYNNAGIGYSATRRMGVGMDDIVSCTIEDWHRILDINLGGVFLFCKFGIPMLIERGGGSVINTASVAALKGSRNAHAYAASKGGIVALTRAMAVTYGRNGVRVNAICPGVIDTDMIRETLLGSDAQTTAIQRMTPMGRIGTADDIARMALFLASDAGQFVTGQAIPVDGGVTA
jgi:NAD(P)-dependent dehydrogenase (short-subunit alcohol dehydrogenase family)